MNWIRFLGLFLIFFRLLIVGKEGLDVATAIIQQGIFRVPDLMGVEVAWKGGVSYLDLLRGHPEVASFYLHTLWTYDVLFPIGLCGVCYAFVAAGPLPRVLRWLPLLVLAADLGAENVMVTLALRAPISQMAMWEVAWQWATTCKWCLTYATISCAVVSAVGICATTLWSALRISFHVVRVIVFKAIPFLIRVVRQRFSSVAVRVKT